MKKSIYLGFLAMVVSGYAAAQPPQFSLALTVERDGVIVAEPRVQVAEGEAATVQLDEGLRMQFSVRELERQLAWDLRVSAGNDDGARTFSLVQEATKAAEVQLEDKSGVYRLRLMGTKLD